MSCECSVFFLFETHLHLKPWQQCLEHKDVLKRKTFSKGLRRHDVVILK